MLVLPERSDWMIRLVGPDRAILLDDPNCWSQKSDLIGRSGDLSSGTFDGLLVSQLQTVVREQQENDTRNAFLFCDKFAVQTVVARKINQRPSLFILLNLPVVEF